MTPTSECIRVLGIDPGSQVTGYGLVLASGEKLQGVAYGAWRLPARCPLPSRLLALYNAIGEAIAAFRPDEVAIEDFYVGQVRAAVTHTLSTPGGLIQVPEAVKMATSCAPMRGKSGIMRAPP